MSVVNISASRNLPEADHDPLAQLAASLSRRLTRVALDDMPAAIAKRSPRSPRRLASRAAGSSSSPTSGSVTRVHSATGTVRTDGRHRRWRRPGWSSASGAARWCHLATRGTSAGSHRQPRAGAPGRRLFDPGRAGLAPGPGDLRPRRRQRPVAAALAGAAGRTAAAAVGDPGVGVAAPPARDGAARQRHVIERLNARLEADNVLSEGRDQELPRLRRHRRRKRVAAARVGAAVAGRAHELERVAARSDRHRQGAVRPGVARTQPAPRASAGAGQLRRAAADAGRKRAVRA